MYIFKFLWGKTQFSIALVSVSVVCIFPCIISSHVYYFKVEIFIMIGFCLDNNWLCCTYVASSTRVCFQMKVKMLLFPSFCPPPPPHMTPVKFWVNHFPNWSFLQLNFLKTHISRVNGISGRRYSNNQVWMSVAIKSDSGVSPES